MKSRIEQLHQFAYEDPEDPFNWYALALEYKKLDTGKAIEILNRLLKEHREYIPTYYQLGKLYHDSGKIQEALQVFEEGVDLSRKQNDLKTLHELKAALLELQFDS